MTNSATAREGTLILGAPRSGTTLLRRLLNAHPEFAAPGETNLFTSCARFLQTELIAEDVDISVLSGLSFAGFPDEEVLDRLREFAFQFMRDYAERQDKPRWVEKTAFNSFFVDPIEKLCGDHVHYVCILRHGMDVTCSIKELCDVNGTYLSELHDYVKQNPKPLEAFAHAWSDVTQSILRLATRRPGVVLIKYEDLVQNPDKVMSDLCISLGTRWKSEYLNSALTSKDNSGLGDWKTYGKSTMDRSSINRWSDLSATTIRHLSEIVNETLVAAGYDSIKTDDVEESSDDARRRYELAMMMQAMLKGGEDEAGKRD